MGDSGHWLGTPAVRGLLLPVWRTAWILVALYVCACAALQAGPSFVNAPEMPGANQGMWMPFGVTRGMGSVRFGIFAQLANVLIVRFGLTAVPVLTIALSAVLALSALCFPDQGVMGGEADFPAYEHFDLPLRQLLQRHQ